jgi:predicted nucleotidyltransferase
LALEIGVRSGNMEIRKAIMPLTLDEIRTRYKDRILAIARKYHAGNVRVFGSILHGNTDDKSDLDLLVTLSGDADLMDLGGLYCELEQLMGRKVDVVPDNAHLYFPDILREAVPL